MSGPIEVSVIVPTYNRPETVRGAVDSVLAQQREGLEIVLVDDGSPADVAGTLDGMAAGNERLRVVHQENRGLAAARNEGARVAQGKWVLFLDDDDLLGEGALAALLRGARAAGSRAVACGAWAFEAPLGRVVPRKLWDGRHDFRVWPLFGETLPERVGVRELFLAPRFPPCGVLLARQLVLELGGFDETLSAAEDYDLWFRVIDAVGPIPVIPGRHVWYRVHSRQMSAQLLRMATQTLTVLERVWHRHRWLFWDGAARRRLAMLYQEAAYASLVHRRSGSVRYVLRGLGYWPLRPKLWLYLFAAGLAPGMYRRLRGLWLQ